MLSTEKTRLPAPPADNIVMPFRTVKSDVIGRVIRLGSVVDAILSRHAYPEPVSHALGEAITLTAMLGSALKEQAKLILQTKTDGPMDFLVADFGRPGRCVAMPISTRRTARSTTPRDAVTRPNFWAPAIWR
jgi:redox-regulated HSP33 family molecular chaperone